MKIVRTWACSLTLLSVIVGGMSAIPAPLCAQKADTSAKIRLTGAPIGRTRPEGSAESRTQGTRSRFKAEAERVNLANGTVLMVNLNGAAVGTITLAAGKGELELEGKGVPAVQKGTAVTITDAAGNVVLQGSF